MTYILNEKQKAIKAEQMRKRYFELKEQKIRMKALAIEQKNKQELERKELIRKNKIYNFHHMKKYRPQTEQLNKSIDILLDVVDTDSDEDNEIINIQPVKFKFI